LVRNQLYLSGLGIVLGFLSWQYGGRDLNIGIVLGTLNFYFLAKFVQEVIYVQRGALAALLFHFYLRLLGTGVALFYVIVYLKANIIALLCGLSLVVINVMWYGAKLVSKKFKEA